MYTLREWNGLKLMRRALKMRRVLMKWANYYSKIWRFYSPGFRRVIIETRKMTKIQHGKNWLLFTRRCCSNQKLHLHISPLDLNLQTRPKETTFLKEMFGSKSFVCDCFHLVRFSLCISFHLNRNSLLVRLYATLREEISRCTWSWLKRFLMWKEMNGRCQCFK